MNRIELRGGRSAGAGAHERRICGYLDRIGALRSATWAGLCAATISAGAWAAGEQQLSEMTIQAEKPALPANLPATTEGVTAKQIAETSNAVTSGETIQYLPSVHVRQRFIGDRNAILSMRTNSSIASAQTIVYADGLLLSNFLNNSFSTPPRWNMVSPEEIERVDVIYGPFSALYPGNSMSGIVLMTTRMPERFEGHAKLDVFGQRFKLFGTDQAFNGAHGSASIGNKAGAWTFWLSGDHLDNEGHPQTFGNTTRKTGAPAAAGTFTVVDPARVIRDIDTTGAPRILTSSLGADHSVQDNGKLKVAYDFSPTLRATYILGLWQNKSDVSIDSYLRDGAGNTVYNAGGAFANPFKFVRIDGIDYTVSAAVPSLSESEHWMHGLTLKSNTGGTWDWEAIASFYSQDKEILRTAAPTNGLDSGNGSPRPPGTITIGDGTSWQTLDLRGEWRPGGDLKSAHQVSFGAHYDRYILKSATFNVPTDWLSAAPAGAPTNDSYGKTQTQALYLQDAWQFKPDWKLVLGGRLERWKAFDGRNFGIPKYLDRASSDFSPKAALSFQASNEWALRGALGKAVRYPTVAEMFQSFVGPNNVRQNDPNLKPEQVVSAELAAERALANGIWRTSLFWEDKRDALVSQTDTTVSPNISSIQNVDKIRTRGIETALQISDLWVRGFDFSGSVTYADSKIMGDSRNPGLVGTDQPRIPRWRATAVGVYHASDRLSYALAARYSSHQHAALFNTATGQYNDINPDVYGAVSQYFVVDAKILYKVAKQWTASVGVNNVGNYTYFVNPNPYPQRTYFASLKFDY